MSVIPGLEIVIEAELTALRGQRVALLCNHTAIDRRLRHAIDRLREAGVSLVRLLGPEHGVRSTAQDMEEVRETTDPVSGLPVVSLYGSDEASLRPRAEDLQGVDLILADIQDIGTRYYTYQATLGFVMQAAGAQGIPVWVLDRPNPITGTRVEGGVVAPGFDSFVGAWPLAVRHGMTLGELARWFVRFGGVSCDLRVVGCEGWSRAQWFEDTGLPWVFPSPNMPTVETALIYPGMCLFEATEWSEGRGTTRPFHQFGAPGVDAWKLVSLLEQLAADAGLRGVGFRPTAFRPGFQKHAGVTCCGAEIHVFDRERLDAFRLGLVAVEAAWRVDPASFRWREAPYEFVSDRHAFDLLTGDERCRRALEEGRPMWTVIEDMEVDRRAFVAERAQVLLYP